MWTPKLWATWQAHILCACSCSVAQSYLTLCDPVDCIPQGSSAHGIFQGRILEWVTISFSRGSSQPRKWTYISFVSYICGHILYHQCHLGSPDICCRSQVINVSTKLKCDSTWRWQWGKKDEQSGHKLKCIEASLGEQKKLHSNSMHVFEGSSKGFTGESGISEEPQWMKDGSEFLHSPKASRQFFPGLCWFSLLLFPPPSPHFCSASTPSRMSFHLLCTWMLLIPYDPDWALQFRASHSCTDSCILKCL